jgi:hypothetical protein
LHLPSTVCAPNVKLPVLDSAPPSNL